MSLTDYFFMVIRNLVMGFEAVQDDPALPLAWAA